jgi:16S rRNA (adenine1518-N6/adenine1519-N6)-dimethyltransferase
MAENRKAVFAKKSFGQNFLVDQNYISKIIQSLDLSGSETVIEIGPGRGALTEKLLQQAGSVIAIELDRDMIELLKVKFSDKSNFLLIEDDVLKLDLGNIVASELMTGGSVKLVANLPYYISTAVLQQLIEHGTAFSEMVLMFQREVVERISAKPGESERGFLTVLVEAYLKFERLFDVPPTAFRPVPKIWSSVLRMRTRDLGMGVDKEFIKLLSNGFAQKRKTIFNNLKLRYSNAAEALAKADIDPTRRAETLSLDEWTGLYSRLDRGAESR